MISGIIIGVLGTLLFVTSPIVIWMVMAVHLRLRVVERIQLEKPNDN